MRGVEECLTAGGPWSLEEIENVTGYMSMKDWQLGEQQAEIERLKLDADLSEITIARQREEIEQLKSLFKEAADYLDKGHGTSIGGGSIFHQQFREQGS